MRDSGLAGTGGQLAPTGGLDNREGGGRQSRGSPEGVPLAMLRQNFRELIHRARGLKTG